jgi:hypothetical protein
VSAANSSAAQPLSPEFPESRAARLQLLRQQIAAVPSRVGSAAHGDAEAGLLPVPGALQALLPGGGLARGTVVSATGSASLLLGIVAAVTAAEGHVALVGQPQLGLLAAAEMGACLERIAVVEDPGPDPLEIAAILLDGMDLVVVGLAAPPPPSRARVLAARARSKGSTLLVAGGDWSGSALRLTAEVVGYDGIDDARRGRVCGARLSVRASGRSGPPRSKIITLACGRHRAAEPAGTVVWE